MSAPIAPANGQLEPLGSSTGASRAGDVAGRPVVLDYGDTAAEYVALRSGVGLVDRSYRSRYRVTGPKAAETITGLVTNDVLALAPGHGLYAAALTAKGRVVTDMRIFALPEDTLPGGLLLDVPPRAAAGWAELVRKYVNPRLATCRDESATLRAVGVFGPQARRVISELTGLNATALGILPTYALATAHVGGAAVIVARVPDLGVEGYEMYAPAEAAGALWEGLRAAGATPAGLDAWEIARVEAGRPEWGLDVDDGSIAQEANLEELHAISYTKGCYTGQEVVARVHFRGHVNRHLRGLHFLPADAPLPPARAPLFDASGKAVGDVRTVVRSPRLGPIALAMLRREVEPGDALSARWDGGEAQATARALPFEG